MSRRVEIVDTAPPARRSVVLAMWAICLSGIAVALVLTVTEAVNGEPVRVSDVTHEEAGGVLTVEADVSNHTDVDRCPDIRALALDGEARDLAEVTAQPVEGEGRLAPDETVRYRAVIDSLSRAQLDEELDDISLYVYEPHRCDR